MDQYKAWSQGSASRSAFRPLYALQKIWVLCPVLGQELHLLPERLPGVVLLHVELEDVGAVGPQVAEAALGESTG